MGLRKEKADQAREMATLSADFESERSAAAHQLNQATEAHAAAIKIVRDDLSQARQDHAVAIETVRAELASSRESFKLLREENSDFQRDYQQQEMAIETLTGEKFQLEAGLQSCRNDLHRSGEESRTAIDKLKSDLQECNDALEQHRQASRAQLDNLSSEKTGLESSLQTCQDALEKQRQENLSTVDILLKEKAGLQIELGSCQAALQTSEQDHRSEIDKLSEEMSKLDADWKGRHDALGTLNQKSQAEVETLSRTNSEMEKKANARYKNLNTSYHASQRDMKVLKQHISRLENLHQSSRLLLRAATRNMVPLDSADSFFKLQSEFMTQRDALPGDSEPYDRHMPRMMFEPNGFQHAPVIHAINFNFALRTGKISFRDSQALFNAPAISADNCVYPFVLEALDTAVANIERLIWPVNQISFNAILTVIQGVAYLTYLAKAMQISGTDVETLGNRIQACLAQKCQGSVLESVFNQIKISSSGQPITTWLGHNNSNHQLDSSNSALGPGRCIIGDATAPKNFVLLDQVGADEVLYTFVEEEVSAVELDTDICLHLVLGDNFTSDQVDRRFRLSMPINHLKHVIEWCSIFLPYKLAES